MVDAQRCRFEVPLTRGRSGLVMVGEAHGFKTFQSSIRRDC